MVTALFWRRIGILTAAAGLLVGCMSASAQNQITLNTPAATAIPSGTSDPRAMAAISTYSAFTRTSLYSLRYPTVGPKSDKGNFSRYSMDPVQGQYDAFVSSLVRTKHAFRGTPPKSTVSVAAIDLDADPYPLITLSDCQTDTDTWRAYDLRTRKMNPRMVLGIPAPYGLLVEVAYLKQRWNVQAIKADPAGTCTG